MKLDNQDLKWALTRLPKKLLVLMQDAQWQNSIFVGGGYLRSIVSNEPVNDVDVFVKNVKDAELLAYKLADNISDIYKTDNAFTVKGKLPIQIIHRWTFDKIEDVSNSFDFTICCAAFTYNGENWDSYCDDRFYIDLANKRLVYRSPVRNEDAGGSALRVLKYYQKGYRIPLDSFGAVIARLVQAVEFDCINSEKELAKVLTGLLREVDPDIDPSHRAHLTSMEDRN